MQVFVLAQLIYERGYAVHEDFHAANVCKSLRSGPSNQSSYIWVDYANTTKDGKSITDYQRTRIICDKLFSLYLVRWALVQHQQSIITSLRAAILQFALENLDTHNTVLDRRANLMIEELRLALENWVAKHKQKGNIGQSAIAANRAPPEPQHPPSKRLRPTWKYSKVDLMQVICGEQQFMLIVPQSYQ